MMYFLQSILTQDLLHSGSSSKVPITRFLSSIMNTTRSTKLSPNIVHRGLVNLNFHLEDIFELHISTLVVINDDGDSSSTFFLLLM